MGKIDEDQLLIILLLNALCGDYSRLQTSVNDLLHNPSTTSREVRSRLLREEQTIGINDKQSAGNATSNTALAAISNKSKPSRPLCANCERPGHKAEFCIAEGGQMAGKTLDEARAAQAAQKAATSNTNKRGNRNTTSQSTTTAPPSQPQTGAAKSLMINGKQYMLVDNTANTATTPSITADTNTALSAMSIRMPTYDEDKYFAVLATDTNPSASLDWDKSSTPVLAYSTGGVPIAHANGMPFILDTGATCHISPDASDFKDLRSIPRHPVKGLGGSAVYATGIGNIELRIASGHTLKLVDALYIPESRV